MHCSSFCGAGSTSSSGRAIQHHQQLLLLPLRLVQPASHCRVIGTT
jgi:hypothetical protein